ncbi:PEP-CTERM sorting domain-containing protein [Bradyrhizobium sp. INPA01-394B]|uniref:PEP-CTERM sorting domain-containing protein n=1 Tax=Bradyrhizobium campsiandrae TaxID=1729892 RepID=A0ABR7UFZ0_9BRAD|nr:PEP-CTERM sorting domain-containing protein [Bradyrhizobium campsiandrae]MBC9878330.1 PEP-CTERM sorting domain-containing protein [Bradyrhizobium campsiandrae]MBC9982412.1 PEP-CTERM sorting domain-containing protein [Bradyrhizobium campsiandrae]
MKFLKSISSGLLLGLVVSSAQAAILTEGFTFKGKAYDISGQFTYDTSLGNTLLSINGAVLSVNSASAGTGGPIKQLIPVTGFSFYPNGPGDAYFSYDNVFDPVAGKFTGSGILFSFGSGNFGNLYFGPGAFFSTWLPNGSGASTTVCSGDLYCPGDSGNLDFNAVGGVPEPSTWALMLLGFTGIAALRISAAKRNRRPLRFSQEL